MNSSNSTNDHIPVFHAFRSYTTELLSIVNMGYLVNQRNQYFVHVRSFHFELVVAVYSLIQDRIKNE